MKHEWLADQTQLVSSAMETEHLAEKVGLSQAKAGHGRTAKRQNKTGLFSIGFSRLERENGMGFVCSFRFLS